MATAAYGRQRARSLFTPEQQRVMDQGGNYAGYAVVDGHFTYVGAGRTGQDAYYAVYPNLRPAATATTGATQTTIGDKGAWMGGPAGMIGSPTTGPAPAASMEAPPTVDLSAEQAAAAKAASNRNALALIQGTLREMGLPDSLADWAWSELVAGKSQAEILIALYNRDEFKAEYPEIEARRKAGLAPISPYDVIKYRQEAHQMFRNAGLPPGFFDSKDDFSRYIIGDLSLKELGDRISGAAQAYYNTAPEDREEWRRLGFGDGDGAAYWLDPDIAQPLLQKRTAAAQLSGTAVRTGFGGLSTDEALGLAELDVSSAQAEQGFGTLVRNRELFGALDAGEDQIGREEQLGAGLRGNAAAQRRIEDRAARRRARFQSGGQFAASQQGMGGLGTRQN